MVKTADPNKYLTSFQSAIKKSADRYARVEDALHSAGEPDEFRKAVAEDAAFRLGVLLETFQGEWYLAAISRDPSKFVGVMQGSLNKAVSDAWARTIITAAHPTALQISKRPTLAQIVNMLDPQGFNVTFVDVSAWKKSAEKHLGAKHEARISAIASTPEASSLLHLVKKLRNHLAHASAGSKEEFNKAARARTGAARIGLTGVANIPLQREGQGVTDVGKYLRARPTAGGPRRLEVLHTRLVDVVELLRVT